MSETIATGVIVVFLLLLFYLVSGTVIEKYHMKFGHEASFTLLIGKLNDSQFSIYFRHDNIFHQHLSGK